MSDPQAEKIISDGLPEGWTFHTIQHGDYVTYEVRTEHRFLIMSSTWIRSVRVISSALGVTTDG